MKALDGRKSRTLPTHLKDLRKSAHLPAYCNDCVYRSKEDGGNGICTVYEKDSLCVIKTRINKAVTKYSTRNPDQLIPLLQEEFESVYEQLKFHQAIENMANEYNPEVTKRINAVTNLAKVINDMKGVKRTVEMTETMSPAKRDELMRVLSVTEERHD